MGYMAWLIRWGWAGGWGWGGGEKRRGLGGMRRETRRGLATRGAGARRCRGAVRTRTDRVSHREVRKGKRESFANPDPSRIVQSSCRGTQHGAMLSRLCWAVCVWVSFWGGVCAPVAG